MEPEKFEVQDSAGNVVTVIAVAEEIPAPSHDDPHATIPGMISLTTEDGDPVYSVQGDYVINGRRYRKV